MDNKEILYEFIDNMIKSDLMSKEEVLEVFTMVIRDNFTPEEMMTSMMNKFKGKTKSKKKQTEKVDIMSYPSVVGIPINLVYEKIFSKK